MNLLKENAGEPPSRLASLPGVLWCRNVLSSIAANYSTSASDSNHLLTACRTLAKSNCIGTFYYLCDERGTGAFTQEGG